MAKVLGDDDNEVATFDRVRAAIKAAKGRKKNKEMLDYYKLLSSKLGTRVLASYANLDKELKEIEKKYYLEHGTLPNKTTNELYSSTLKKRNMAKAILRNLDITL